VGCPPFEPGTPTNTHTDVDAAVSDSASVLLACCLACERLVDVRLKRVAAQIYARHHPHAAQ
jgi:hypothetical protein